MDCYGIKLGVPSTGAGHDESAYLAALPVVAIEFPNPDFAALARACGGHGYTARKPDDLLAAIAEALEVDGPAIVDAVVASDEMPNMPHVELEQVGHYAIAKIKEAVLAVTGG